MDITGTQIKNLKILSEIGEGGMGVVFLATHVILEKKFAVKCLTPELSTSLQFRERFEKEAMAQAALNHPNIVQVNDFFEHNDRYYLVMEYVDGHSLADMIDHGGKLSEQNALPILKDILAGVNFAHSRGIIHRDIKPSNILIDKSGRAKIMDFGIAIRAGDDHRLTKTGVDIGTAWYVSPEQVVNPKGVDHRSDVYSIGVVLFEMLTGMTPFDGETDYTIKDKHVRETPRGVNEINPDVSDELSGIVIKALEKLPDDRFNGCGDFLEYVEAYDHQLNGLESTGVSNVSEDAGTTGTSVPLKPPEPTFEDPITGMEFVYVHGGEFTMGEGFESENGQETQTQKVELDGFYIGRNPVTCGQWKHLMGVDPSAFSAGDSYPVEMVSWDNAQEFIEKLTEKNNREYLFRLPTEAEWEYTARSGGKAEKYSGSDTIDTVAWYDRNSDNGTRPVGWKAPNGLGIHDMSGNVWEWCGDWFGDFRSSGDKNPTGPPVGAQRVLRGGSWSSNISQCQSTCRYRNWPEYKDRSWGLRLVRDIMPPEPLSSLSVASSPKGASIWIGDRDTGEKTDTLIELPPGKYKVRLTSDGYEATTQEVEIVSGAPAEVEFRLKKIPASIPVKKKRYAKATIVAGVAGVICFFSVFIGLIFHNQNSQNELPDPVEIVADTKKNSEGSNLEYPVKQPSVPNKILEPERIAESKLFVKLIPKDANVRFLNIDQKFQQGMVLKPGHYHLEVSHDGCKTQRKWVNLTAGKIRTIQVHLEWIMSRLFVETEPRNALVRILNVKQKFRQGMLLEPGRYHVEVSCEGYNTHKSWETLKVGKKRVLLIELKAKSSEKPKVSIAKKDTAPQVPSQVPPADNKTNENKPHNGILTNNDGKIWDPNTGLEWIVGPDEATTFSKAKKWLTQKNSRIRSAKPGSWRIPTIREMQTICNKWKQLPPIFKTTGWFVWSYKEPYSDEVWVYDLRIGNAVSYKYVSNSYKRVFAVRSRRN